MFDEIDIGFRDEIEMNESPAEICDHLHDENFFGTFH
jgi:hypothetical protein